MELTIEVDNDYKSLPKKNKDIAIKGMKEIVNQEIRIKLGESIRKRKDQAPEMTEQEVFDYINEAKNDKA